MDVLVWVVAAVFTLVTALVMAGVVRRLLGIRFGRVRLLLAGALAFLVSGPIFSAMANSVRPDDPTLTPIWFFLLSVVLALLAAMVFLVVAEALVPTGSVPPPYEWVRAVRGRVARARRYAQISRIAFRHGLGPGLRRAGSASPADRARTAGELRTALEEGGVTFVKLGQLLSTRRDLLPAELVDELGRLRDRAAPVPREEILAAVAAELSAPAEEVFATFDETPLAAASVAQVHAATLRTGEEVVVKVQRPGVRPGVERDLEIVHRLARSLETSTSWARSIGARDLAFGFAAALREELDFRVEAANLAAVAATARDDVVLPVAIPALCTERVLVMRRLVGTPLAEAQVTAAVAHDLARTLLRAVLRQVTLDGVFHADPHAGNVLLLADGRLGLLDFGSVGRLDAAVRGALQRLLLAVDRGDPLGVSDALLEVVPRPDEIDEQALERAVGVLLARHLGPGATAGVKLFTDLFRIVAAFGLSVPPEVAAVFRALATLEGTLTELAPGFDLVAEARAYAAGQLAEQWRTGSPRQLVTDELTTLLPMLRRLPRRLERIAGAVEHGRLTVNVRLFSDERDRRYATGLLEQLLLTVLGATAGIMGALLLTADGGPVVTGTTTLHQLLGYFLLVISSVLVLRVLVVVFRPGP
jgi:ubiquinone biosynthesis protein